MRSSTIISAPIEGEEVKKISSLIVVGPLKRFERYLKLFTDRLEVGDDTKLIAILLEGRPSHEARLKVREARPRETAFGPVVVACNSWPSEACVPIIPREGQP